MSVSGGASVFFWRIDHTSCPWHARDARWAAHAANLSGGALEVSDAAWLGDLCCACCNMGGCGGDAPLAWACFGLLMIPRMSEKVLLQLSTAPPCVCQQVAFNNCSQHCARA